MVLSSADIPKGVSPVGIMAWWSVTASRFEVGKSLTDGFIGEGGNPQAVERLIAIEIGIDVSEDEFTFTSCIGSNDDAVCLAKAGAYHLELF